MAVIVTQLPFMAVENSRSRGDEAESCNPIGRYNTLIPNLNQHMKRLPVLLLLALQQLLIGLLYLYERSPEIVVGGDEVDIDAPWSFETRHHDDVSAATAGLRGDVGGDDAALVTIYHENKPNEAPGDTATAKPLAGTCML